MALGFGLVAQSTVRDKFCGDNRRMFGPAFSSVWTIVACLKPAARNSSRNAPASAPNRSQNTTWKDFIASHMAVLAGTDRFTVEVLTWRGLATYYVLFFIHLETRRVSLAGLTRHLTSEWMLQRARNATDENSGFLRGQQYPLHDRDAKSCAAFLGVLRSSGIRPLALPPQSPNLNSFAERWVGAIREECLSKLILCGEASLRRALNDYIEHHHFERNHQGQDNLLLFPSPDQPLCPKRRTVRYRHRLGGLLKFYPRAA
jgi:hypothetical protein